MRLSLTTKWFIWLSAAVVVFCLAQILGMIWLEAVELIRDEGTLGEELSEIAVLVSVSLCVFVLMSGGLWFISKRMIKPIRAIAESAHRISAGDLRERLKAETSTEEVAQLVSALNCAFDRYHETVDRLDNFAGNAAHQLRTPLASLRSAAEVCLLKERSPEEYRTCIEELLQISQELAVIVEKLLLIARLNPARVRRQFTSVSMDDQLSQVVSVFAEAMEEKNIRLELCDAPRVKVMGDATLIRQAIGNVVENAMRFTPEGGIVAITLHESESGVALNIADTGPGIPEALRQNAGNSANATWNGHLSPGRLGLAIVSEIMRIHEGTVEIRQQDGGGTSVALRWPPSTGRQHTPS